MSHGQTEMSRWIGEHVVVTIWSYNNNITADHKRVDSTTMPWNSKREEKLFHLPTLE
jgi:hypothetical protein